MRFAASPRSIRNVILTVAAATAAAAATLLLAQSRTAASNPSHIVSLIAACSLTAAAGVAGYFKLASMRREKPVDPRQDSLLLAFADSILDGFLLLEPVYGRRAEMEDFTITLLNRKARLLLNAPSDAIVGSRLRSLVPAQAADGLLEALNSVMRSGEDANLEFAVSDPRVRATWLRCHIARCQSGIALTLADQTERKQFEASIFQASHHDPLTGLPNYGLMDDRIQQAIERAKRHQLGAALLMLDLEGYERIKQQYGCAGSDFALKTVAARLQSAVRSTDSVFRLSGDTFVVLYTDLPLDRSVTNFAQKIALSLMHPIPWQGRQLDLCARIGSAFYPTDGATPESLMVHADISRFRAQQLRDERSLRRASETDAIFSRM